eukprot:jgi/Bigna1/87103/estExt_fgenesh1_pg.C_160228
MKEIECTEPEAKSTQVDDATTIATEDKVMKTPASSSSSSSSSPTPSYIPPPKKQNTPLPSLPSGNEGQDDGRSQKKKMNNGSPTVADIQTQNQQDDDVLVESPTDKSSRSSTLRTKRSWSVSDLATAVTKKVFNLDLMLAPMNNMAERAKLFFNHQAMESPDAKEDEREASETRRKKEWQQLLEKRPTRPQMATSSRVNKLCWKGIPGSIRGKAWKAIIGNELKITPELFSINVKRGRKLWGEQIAASEKANARARRGSSELPISSDSKQKEEEDDDDDDASREDSMRIIRALLSSLNLFSFPLIAVSIASSLKDIPRTFPQLKFFHKEGPLHEPLLKVLQAYVCYRPDVGYVQGMSYLAAILLLNMCTEDAFQCLANLLNQDIYFAFFRMDVDKMETHLKVYQTLMKEKLPKLYDHFEEIEIKPGMYLYEWLLTIYSRSLPIDIAHRIWDNFLFHGQVFLFRTALGILRLFGQSFLTKSFEDCLSILNRPPEDINEAALFENINRIQLTSKRFDRLVHKFMLEGDSGEKRAHRKSI